MYYFIWYYYSCYTVLPNIAMTHITGMSLQTKESYFIYLSSFSRTVYIEIEELKEWQMVIPKNMVLSISESLFSTYICFPPMMKAQDVWRSQSFERHICFLKRDRIVVRVLGSQSTPCNKSSVSKLQLWKLPKISALHPKAVLFSLISHTYPWPVTWGHIRGCLSLWPPSSSPGLCLHITGISDPGYPHWAWSKPPLTEQPPCPSLSPSPERWPGLGFPDAFQLTCFCLEWYGMSCQGLPGSPHFSPGRPQCPECPGTLTL